MRGRVMSDAVRVTSDGRLGDVDFAFGFEICLQGLTSLWRGLVCFTHHHHTLSDTTLADSCCTFRRAHALDRARISRRYPPQHDTLRCTLHDPYRQTRKTARAISIFKFHFLYIERFLHPALEF